MSVHIYIFFIVCMISSNICRAHMHEISDVCRSDHILQYFLTYGMGRTDALVLLLTNLSNINCTLIFNTKKNTAQILAIETLINAGFTNDYFNNITIYNNHEINSICTKEYEGSKCAYAKLWNGHKNSVHLNVKSLKSIKITATSAKYVNSPEHCNEIHEIHCKLDGISVCISKELQCDKHINCGSYNLNDEDSRICKIDIAMEKKVVIISVGFILAVTLVTIMTYRVRKYSPVVPKAFFITYEIKDYKLMTQTHPETTLSTQKINAQENPQDTLEEKVIAGKKMRNKLRNKRIRNNSPVTECKVGNIINKTIEFSTGRKSPRRLSPTPLEFTTKRYTKQAN